jgi:1-deoxy-D-xylulose-5-phosphate reductoisomerase
MGTPDMRLPIQLALSWPERWADAAQPLDWQEPRTLTFAPPDEERFPALRLARLAGERGGTAPAVFNAANEAAGARFLAGDIGFLDIARLVADVLERHRPAAADSLEAVEEADRWARAAAARWR